MQLNDCPSEWAKKLAITNGRADKYMCNYLIAQIYFKENVLLIENEVDKINFVGDNVWQLPAGLVIGVLPSHSLI